ncbi:MAG: MoxR family ATPase [Rhodococcus sp.]|nr:MoxR family ATPase [Rhodococcus sp. (in: high G+C Gram-positive bacteria)]
MSVTDFDTHSKYATALAHYNRVLAWGPPGTGKTHAAVHSATSRDEEFVKITCTGGDMAAEYRGMFIPMGDKGFEFVLGVATTAWCELNDGAGGLLILDEINHAPEEVHSLLHAILDDPAIAQLTLPNKVMIKPGPKFRAVGTQNAHPNDLAPPLLDRFQARVHVDRCSPGALDLLPSDLREKAENLITHPDEDQRVSFRSLLAFSQSRHIVGEEMAAQLCFGDRWNEVVTAIRLM